MRAHFGDRPLPETEAELEHEIVRMFKHLTGRSFNERREFHVPKYDSGGMSSGFISPQFWRNEAMPLLKHRFAGRD
jgi:molybdenum cofactor cytidylyltransferase